MKEENKILYKDIVQALKFAISQGEPDGIGFWNSSMKWREFSVQDVLDFINSQKEEIEQLNKRNEELTSIAEYQQNSNMRRWEIIKEKEKENAELQKQVDNAKEQFLLTCKNCHFKKDIELLKYQKEQAVKEFAERVKAHTERCYDWAVAKIVSAEVDNVLDVLLKEVEE